MYDKRFHHRIEIVPRTAEVYLGEDNHWHIDYFGPDVPCDHEVDTQWNREQAVGIACAFVNGKPRPEFYTPPVIEGATPSIYPAEN